MKDSSSPGFSFFSALVSDLLPSSRGLSPTKCSPQTSRAASAGRKWKVGVGVRFWERNEENMEKVLSLGGLRMFWDGS